MEGGGREEERLGGADGGRWVGSEVGTEVVETSETFLLGCFFGWICSGGL